MKHRYLLPIILSLSATCGCMLNTDRAVAPSPREQWQPSEDAVQEKQTPVPSPVPAPLSSPSGDAQELSAFIDEALSFNPQTQKAWYNAKAAAAQRISANSSFYPSLNVAGNVQRRKIDAIGVPVGTEALPASASTMANTTVAYGPLFDISYTLFTFGAQNALADAAVEALYAANFQYNRVLQDVVLAVQQAFYRLQAAEASVLAQEASVKDAQASLDAAETKSNVGLSPIQDVLRAKANLLEEQYRLQTTNSLVEAARANLAREIGRSDVASVRIKAAKIQAMSPQGADNIKDLIQKSLELRPDLQAAYAFVRAKESEKRSTERSLLPQLVGGISSDLTKLDGYTGLQENYLAYIRLQWNLFDGFNKEAKVLKARSELELAKRDAKSAELAIVSDVWTQYFDFQTAREQLSSAAALVSANEASYAAIETGYNNGLNSILDLLSTQRDLANARLVLIKAEANYVISLVKLEHAVGTLSTSAIASSWLQ